MAQLRGLLSLPELAECAQNGDIDTVIVAFCDHVGRLLGKRCDAEYFLEEVCEGGTHGCDYLLTADMEMEPVRGYRFANWELGYGDVHLVPDLATLRRVSWLEHTALVLCDVTGGTSHEPVRISPRAMLKRQLERAAVLGFGVRAASELEYYLFNTSYRDAAKGKFMNLEPAGWYLEDYHILQGSREEGFTATVRRHLRDSGIPVESSKGEWGLGQHEVNVRHAEALEMADRHLLFKQCLKETADQLGLSVTFMAKFKSGQAGSSCHIHLSLWEGEAQTNAFAGDQASDTFRHFLGGWIAHAPEFMVFYAPTVNAYKRYEDASWAPTRLAWSRDNRTAGFRVVGAGQSLRIECRLPGADCNPYLAYTAALASGLDGIARKLEPPEAFDGDIYAASDLPRVPYTLGEATGCFARSAFVKEMLGEEVAEHYSHYFRSEQRAFDAFVTDWERKRYFERI